MNKFEKAFMGTGILFLTIIFFSTGTIAGVGMRAAVAAPLYWLGLIGSNSAEHFAIGTWLPW